MDHERSHSMTPSERSWLFLRHVVAMTLLASPLVVLWHRVFQQPESVPSRSNEDGKALQIYQPISKSKTSWDYTCSTKYVPVDALTQGCLLLIWVSTHTSSRALPLIMNTSATVSILPTTLSESQDSKMLSTGRRTETSSCANTLSITETIANGLRR